MTTYTLENPSTPSDGVALLGGKAENLLRLRRAGFAVPDFFVVPTTWFDAVIAPWRETLQSQLAGVNALDRERIEQVSQDTARWLGGRPLDVRLRDTVERELRARPGARFAVRSSVRGEDSSTHSFAGLMDSRLNVTAPEVLDAIVDVWKSAFTPRAIAYRLHHALSVHDLSAAVVVQVMVDSRTSGVAFSREPEGGSARCVVVAGHGLGEGIVGDRVATDEYRVDRHDGTIQARCATRRPVLADEQIRRVCDEIKRIEAEMGSPQDVEWAFDAHGALHVLQARPIVFRTPSTPPAEAEVRIWDNSNIVESYPGLTLPLTFSVAREAYEHIFRNAARGLAPTNPVLRRNEEPAFENLIGLVKGRVYYSLVHWYTMLSYLPGFRRHRRAWDAMIGIDQPVELPVATLSWRDRAAGVLCLGWRLLTNRGNVEHFLESFQEIYGRHRGVRVESLADAELAAAFESLERDTQAFWHRTLYNDFCAMTYFEVLRRWTTEWAGAAGVHNDLLAAEGSIESVAPLRSLLDLVDAVREEPLLQRLVEAGDDEACWDAVQTAPGFEPVRDRVASHIERYGDRVAEELKLETPTLRDEPARIFDLIRRHLRTGSVNEAAERDAALRRMRAEDEVRARLRDPGRRLAFEFVLRRCRHAVASRENMRLARGRIYGLVRRIFREAGRRLVARGVLKDARDVFLLTRREALDALRTPETPSLDAVVSARRREYSAFASIELPTRFLRRGDADAIAIEEADLPACGGLQGVGCSSGRVSAPARVVLDCRGDHDVDGRILVARSTDPAWIFLMMRAAGLVVERGSVLSHTAIVGRELGIPTVVGVRGATKRIVDGDHLTIDGSTGEVSWA